MKNKLQLDFDAICGLCLREGPDLRPIFDCDVDFPCRIESCVGIDVRPRDRGPSQMCADCLSRLESWEEFRQTCITSDKRIRECLDRSREEASNSTPDKLVKPEDERCNVVCDGAFNDDFSNNDEPRSPQHPVLITVVREAYPRAAKHDGKLIAVPTVTCTKTPNKNKRYECGMCIIQFSKKESLFNHLIDFHRSEDNNTPHYCLLCNKGYCSYKIYQDHLTAEPSVHSLPVQIQDKVKDCNIDCGLCSCKFRRSASLYRHLRAHALKKDLIPHLCSFCQVGFLDTYSLSLHASVKHHAASVTVNESIKKCTDEENSSLNLKQEQIVITTIANHDVDGEFKDNNFAITTKRKIKKLKTVEDKRAKYREHYRRFQSKTYTCEFCNVSYSRFCDLSNHDRTTHDDMPKEFSCPICGKLFLTENRQQIHQNAFHGEKTFSCDMCNVRCKSKHTLRTHMRKHSGIFTCSYCNLTTASNAALVSHVRIHTGEKPFVCDLCGNSYASKLGLTSHKRTHQQEVLFKCNICGYTGTSHSSIYIHKQTHNADKPFVCDVCGKTFKIKVRLVDHQKIHFGTKNYVCEVCNKAFLARYQLVQHSRTHSGEKPFQCHLCSKAFARRDGLSEHIRTHTGEKRYTCTECFRTFSFYKSMKNHKCSVVANENKKERTTILVSANVETISHDDQVLPSSSSPLPSASPQPSPQSPNPSAIIVPPSTVTDNVPVPAFLNGLPIWQPS